MFLLNVMFFSVHRLCLIRVLFNVQLKVIQASATQKVSFGVIKAAFHVILFEWGNLSYNGASTVFNKHSECSSKPIIIPPSTLCNLILDFCLWKPSGGHVAGRLAEIPPSSFCQAQSSTRRCDFHLSITTFSVLLGSRSMEAKLTDKVKLTVNCCLPRHWRRGSVINCFVFIIYQDPGPGAAGLSRASIKTLRSVSELQSLKSLFKTTNVGAKVQEIDSTTAEDAVIDHTRISNQAASIKCITVNIERWRGDKNQFTQYFAKCVYNSRQFIFSKNLNLNGIKLKTVSELQDKESFVWIIHERPDDKEDKVCKVQRRTLRSGLEKKSKFLENNGNSSEHWSRSHRIWVKWSWNKHDENI